MFSAKRFPRNFIQSRDMWLAAAREITTAFIEEHLLEGHHGPGREKLYTDVAYFGAAHPQKRKNLKKVLTFRSGTHGAEETASCGIEIDKMDLMAMAQDPSFDPNAPANSHLSEDARAIIKLVRDEGILEPDCDGEIGIVMIRNVTPWASAHMTRDDQDYKDINRSNLPHDLIRGKFNCKLPPPVEIYDSIPDFADTFVPKNPEDFIGEALARRLVRLLEIQNAYPQYIADLMRGQYDDRRKIIWGGDGISQSFRTVEKILDPLYRKAEVIADYDLHSGLGRPHKKPGSALVLLLAEEDGPIDRSIRRDLQVMPIINGLEPAFIQCLRPSGGTAASTWVEGSAVDWLNIKYPDKIVYPCGVELRPLDGLTLFDALSLKGLRLAMRLQGDTHPLTQEIKDRLHHYFCPDDSGFEQQAVADTQRIFRYQLQAMVRPRPLALAA